MRLELKATIQALRELWEEGEGQMIGNDEGDGLVGDQILIECRRFKGPVLIRKTGGHRAQRIVAYGFPAEASITKKWRIVKS